MQQCSCREDKSETKRGHYIIETTARRNRRVSLHQFHVFDNLFGGGWTILHSARGRKVAAAVTEVVLCRSDNGDEISLSSAAALKKINFTVPNKSDMGQLVARTQKSSSKEISSFASSGNVNRISPVMKPITSPSPWRRGSSGHQFSACIFIALLKNLIPTEESHSQSATRDALCINTHLSAKRSTVRWCHVAAAAAATRKLTFQSDSSWDIELGAIFGSCSLFPS